MASTSVRHPKCKHQPVIAVAALSVVTVRAWGSIPVMVSDKISTPGPTKSEFLRWMSAEGAVARLAKR